MSAVLLSLERDAYRPGEELTGAYCVNADPEELAGLEVSVLCRTEGKGTEDLGLLFFRDWSPRTGAGDPTKPQAFQVVLPRTPLSYDGRIVKVRWCARVRVRWADGRGQTLAEQSFRLGNVEPPPDEP